MVVPDQQPRRGRVRGLQRRVALVGGVAGAVLVERLHLAAFQPAHRVLPRRVLVDVVAEEHDEVELLVGDVAPGGVVADVVALAARDREAQRRRRVGGRRGARAADRALLAEGAEAIPVPAAGVEAGRLGVDAVRPGLLGASPRRWRRCAGSARRRRAPSAPSTRSGRSSPMSRVQSTMPSARGWPEAMPRVKRPASAARGRARQPGRGDERGRAAQKTTSRRAGSLRRRAPRSSRQTPTSSISR